MFCDSLVLFRISWDPGVRMGTIESSQLEDEGRSATHDDHLTPAERRYIEQREQLDVRRLAKIANKSHRDRIQDFNQYLANMSEHYDIPKQNKTPDFNLPFNMKCSSLRTPVLWAKSGRRCPICSSLH
ncbi:hypothetical protein IFM89_031547 [Coptis chinensis]|uniref:Protein FAM32A-like n=1 Tax=Coptis chinensis TaxID=261450 RepID=A0A835IHJ9_9MAGN|nr:hypothetical protein IFM89_031547 [Coptis chinensis]